MVDIMDKIHKLSEIGKSTREKQGMIDVSEVFYAWDVLVTKLDIVESIQILENFIDDLDLKLITLQVLEALHKGINSMEKIINEHGIPFPIRPPAGSNSTISIEYFTDRYIFQNLYEGIQAFFPVLAQGFMQGTTPNVKKVFKDHLLITIEIHESMLEYGKMKGFLNVPPVYRA